MGNDIEKGWKKLNKQAIPANAPLIQRREMRRAFYGGAAYALTLMLNHVGDESITEEESHNRFNELLDECRRFIDKMKEGIA